MTSDGIIRQLWRASRSSPPVPSRSGCRREIKDAGQWTFARWIAHANAELGTEASANWDAEVATLELRPALSFTGKFRFDPPESGS